MARILGGIGSSHIPLIGKAIAQGLQQEPYWKRFFEGYVPVHAWLEENKPDVAILFYNDHGLEFFIDKKPTFAVGVADSYVNADEGWGIATIPPVPGDTDLRPAERHVVPTARPGRRSEPAQRQRFPLPRGRV